MPATTGVGVTDTAPGAGIADIWVTGETQGGITRNVQVFDQWATGDRLLLRASASVTPPLVSETLPPITVMTYTVPTGYMLILDGGYVVNAALDETFVRVCRRYLMLGNNAQTAPAAGAAPTLAAAASTYGLTSGSAYNYKYAFIDAFGKESALSVAAAGTITPSGVNLGVSVAMAVLPAGAVGYRVFRTLAAGATYYFCDESATAPFVDVHPDTDLIQTQTPAVTWGAAPTPQTTAGGCELIWENFTALAAAPARLTYLNERSRTSQVAIAPAITLGTRLRAKLGAESRGFVTTPTNASVILPGQRTSDFGATAVKGTDKANATIGGQWVVWGMRPIAWTCWTAVPVAGAVIPMTVAPYQTMEAGTEIVVEIGTTALAAAGVRDVYLIGRLIQVA